MDTISIWELLKEVLFSWQVIVITIALCLYLKIVFYAARRYHQPRMRLSRKINFKKTKSELPVSEIKEDGNDTNDELGLEEA